MRSPAREPAALAQDETGVDVQLAGGEPLLLNLGQPGSLDITGWAHRVQLIDASHAGEWEIPVLGRALSAAVVRPDGYVAWARDGTRTGLDQALTTWLGTAA